MGRSILKCMTDVQDKTSEGDLPDRLPLLTTQTHDRMRQNGQTAGPRGTLWQDTAVTQVVVYPSDSGYKLLASSSLLSP